MGEKAFVFILRTRRDIWAAAPLGGRRQEHVSAEEAEQDKSKDQQSKLFLNVGLYQTFV